MKKALLALGLLCLLAEMAFAGAIDRNEVRRLLAQTKAAGGNYTESISLLREILKDKPSDLEAKKDLARALSWNRQYEDSLRLYDEIISQEDSYQMHLEKARVLGWSRRYGESVKEYQGILGGNHHLDIVEMELKAKEAYWNNRIYTAIKYYGLWLEKDGSNLEALFDVSQIYSYQSMWSKAKKVYKEILRISPTHWRAQEGLRKVQFLSAHPSLESGYEFIEADSASRDMDLKKHTFFNHGDIPVNDSLEFGVDYGVSRRYFSDYADLVENKVGGRIEYCQSPDWRLGGHYSFTEYNEAISTRHEFGALAVLRASDWGTIGLSFDREGLENTSAVIIKGLSKDRYKVRTDWDISKRIVLGAEESYVLYSDDNRLHNPAAELTYFISFSPDQLSAKYRYDYMDFRHEEGDYFSPKNFSIHSLELNWQHAILSQEEFFGIQRIYTELGYRAQLDTARIVMHRLSGALVWDVSQSLQCRLEGQWLTSDRDVYHDKKISAAAKVYF